MFLRNIWIPVTVFLVTICVVCLGFRSETDAETTFAKPLVAAEKLVGTENYYEAILALKPLLMSDTESKEQEDALWLAHTLLIKWEKEIIENGLWGEDTDHKIGILNQLGADFDNIEINFGYRYGFLQRLIDAYPNTLKQPFAEYALIQSGYPVPRDIDETLSALHAYIEKYEETGRAEVYKAYLDIAHIHHGLWAAITFSDHPAVLMYGDFGSGDPEKDKKTADSYKEIALNYYAKFYINPHGLTDNIDYESYDVKDGTGYQLLKRNAAFGWFFIFYGC